MEQVLVRTKRFDRAASKWLAHELSHDKVINARPEDVIPIMETPESTFDGRTVLKDNAGVYRSEICYIVADVQVLQGIENVDLTTLLAHAAGGNFIIEAAKVNLADDEITERVYGDIVITQLWIGRTKWLFFERNTKKAIRILKDRKRVLCGKAKPRSYTMAGATFFRGLFYSIEKHLLKKMKALDTLLRHLSRGWYVVCKNGYAETSVYYILRLAKSQKIDVDKIVWNYCNAKEEADIKKRFMKEKRILHRRSRKESWRSWERRYECYRDVLRILKRRPA